jgi:hypothetical protein
LGQALKHEITKANPDNKLADIAKSPQQLKTIEELELKKWARIAYIAGKVGKPIGASIQKGV